MLDILVANLARIVIGPVLRLNKESLSLDICYDCLSVNEVPPL